MPNLTEAQELWLIWSLVGICSAIAGYGIVLAFCDVD